MSDDVFDHLYRAIKRGEFLVVGEYLDRGGDPNIQNRNGWTLLMVATFKGSSRLATVLLERGADIHATNSVGETALALAAGGGFPKLVALLLGRGSRVDIRPLGQPFSTFLRYAKRPSTEVIKLLTDAGMPNHALQRTEAGGGAGSEFQP